MHIRIARRGPDLDACLAIRRDVFVLEQGVPPEIEYDELDSEATHYLALIEDRPVGCGRVIDKGSSVAIGRVAVIEKQRNCGIGSGLIRRMVDDATASGYSQATLHAQVSAVAFYKKLGFECVGDNFLEANIPHISMRKDLS